MPIIRNCDSNMLSLILFFFSFTYSTTIWDHLPSRSYLIFIFHSRLVAHISLVSSDHALFSITFVSCACPFLPHRYIYSYCINQITQFIKLILQKSLNHFILGRTVNFLQVIVTRVSTWNKEFAYRFYHLIKYMTKLRLLTIQLFVSSCL